MIALTIDIDWSPDAIVHEIMSTVEEYGVPITLYCTDFETDSSLQSSSLKDRYSSRVELGWHPNFQNTHDYSGVLANLKKHYPSALGYRSHNGLSGFPINVLAQNLGICYELSCLISHAWIEPFKYNPALPEFMISMTQFFDSGPLHDRQFGWEKIDLPFQQKMHQPDKLVVLGFHPNILFYDMNTYLQYQEKKHFYHYPDYQYSFLKKGRLTGAMKLFLDILSKTPKHHFTKVADYLSEHKANTFSLEV